MTAPAEPDRLPPSVIETATTHVAAILSFAFEHTPQKSSVVVWDGACTLSAALTEAYRHCLPDAIFIEFGAVPNEEILEAFELLDAGDLVVLIQSTSFRLSAFRIRVELFNRSIKVLEHPHLATMEGEECAIYIDALAYDADYYRGVGAALKARIDEATRGIVESGGEQLLFPAAFESARLNVGDYRALKNTGGQYPIGEVFTESKDLEAVCGRVLISFFADTRFRVNKPPHPITLVVDAGRVVDVLDSTAAFDEVLANIRADEGQVWVRELGFGMNRAFSQERIVSDIGSFERMCGVHLSLGAKHMTYDKPNIDKRRSRHHVDVFVVTDSVQLDGEVIYKNGAWLDAIPSS